MTIVMIGVALLIMILALSQSAFAPVFTGKPDSGEPMTRTREGVVGTEFDAVIAKWSGIRGNLSPAEIKASIQTESSGNPSAVNPGDPSWGLMGVTRLIARAYLGTRANDDFWHTDPDLNIEAGSGFLSFLKAKYSDQFPLSDPSEGWIQMYNVGETKFRAGVRNAAYQRTWMNWLAEFSQSSGQAQ